VGTGRRRGPGGARGRVVSGSRAFESFRRQRPTDAKLQGCRKGLPAAAVKQALDRAYKVAQILRAGDKAARYALRPEYIAVSGEDDQPHRPVNVPWSDFPQYDLEVSVPRRHAGGGVEKVHTRFTIGHRRAPRTTRATFGPREIPPDVKPVLARDAGSSSTSTAWTPAPRKPTTSRTRSTRWERRTGP
jgi:hypothetical protein